jgi:hypothetical protein
MEVEHKIYFDLVTILVSFQLCLLPRKTIYSLPGITATRCKTYSLESLSRFPVPTRDSLPDDIKTTFEEVEEKVDNNLYYCSLFTPITVCDIQGSSWP